MPESFELPVLPSLQELPSLLEMHVRLSEVVAARLGPHGSRHPLRGAEPAPRTVPEPA